MEIQLTKNSDVPPARQLGEQIVFMISTGKLQPGERLPSVRALARRLGIHRNTVSKAYRDLVRREWLRGRLGSRLCVAPAVYLRGRATHDRLDELIDQSTERAREMGFSLAVLRERVAARLALQPPTRLLVVEEEPELRKLIQVEIYAALGKQSQGCSPGEFARDARLAVDTQVIAPEYAFHLLPAVASNDWPPIRLRFSAADQHIKAIRELQEPSIVAVASVSTAFLKTARSLLAAAVGRRHEFREVLVRANRRPDIRGIDVVFCDSLAMKVLRGPKKIHYRLIDQGCLEEIAATFDFSAFPKMVHRKTVAGRRRRVP
jgi:GntR family transcriptional regulator